ncbi:MAG: S-methyl-5-thioribose-1-phosphate isomerase [Methanomassiliicoccales archaeon]|nr:S-methyl-5-thioribose-1-phosphate isomerase [Methanomassiliicoccales archaeon]
MRVVLKDGVAEFRAVWFEGEKVRMIDQRILPQRFEIVEVGHCKDVANAIKDMTIRGAPSIGAAAAYGMALATLSKMDANEAATILKAARPTANDLFYAVDHMLKSIASGCDPVNEANRYADDIVQRCTMIGENGASLIDDGCSVMTHCNAGALATVDVGTALAPIRMAWYAGKKVFVFVSETRPRLQGMRLTAWELVNEGIPHAIITDGASGHFMKKDVDIIIVGADRIASNGDFANKIGTYEKAVVARELGIPFYVAAPVSSFDFSIDSGDKIPIENRSEGEVTDMEGRRIAPMGSSALNPAFDVTPSKYVRGFITETGVLSPSNIIKMRGDRPAD